MFQTPKTGIYMKQKIIYYCTLFILLSPFIIFGTSTKECHQFLQKLETAFQNTNPELLQWSIDDNSCTKQQIYSANYIQGKTAFYLDDYHLSQNLFEKSIEIGGEEDDEILFFLSKIEKEIGSSKGVGKYTTQIAERFPHSLFSDDTKSDKREKGWRVTYTSKYHTTNKEYNTPHLLYNQLSLKLSQSIGDLKIQETIGTYIKSDPSSTFIDGWQGFMGVMALYKQTLFTIGYNFDYTNPNSDSSSSSESWEFLSGHAMISHDISAKPWWEVNHTLLFYMIDPDWYLIDISQAHTFHYKRHSFTSTVSFSKDFISWDDSSATMPLLQSINLLTLQQKWLYRQQKNRWGISGQFEWEREEMKEIPEDLYSDYLITLETDSLADAPEREEAFYNSYLFKSSLLYGREWSDYINIRTELGGGFEKLADEWQPFYLAKLQLKVSF